jgi:hypothetical protein
MFIKPVLTLLVCVSAITAAPVVTYTETSLPFGIEYDYTVTNPLDSVTDAGSDLYDIIFTFTSIPTLVLVPLGWDFSQADMTVQAFSLQVGPPPIGTDVPPGSSLAGFTFLFPEAVGPVNFSTSLINPGNPDAPVVLTGTATPAAPIPEPNTVLLCGLPLAVVVILARASCPSQGSLSPRQITIRSTSSRLISSLRRS